MFKSDSVVFPDVRPLAVPAGSVKRKPLASIPEGLRGYAGQVLPAAPFGEWWTVGEVRGDDGEFVTVVARRRHGSLLAYGTC